MFVFFFSVKDADNHIRVKERLQSDYLPVQENASMYTIVHEHLHL